MREKLFFRCSVDQKKKEKKGKRIKIHEAGREDITVMREGNAD